MKRILTLCVATAFVVFFGACSDGNGNGGGGGGDGDAVTIAQTHGAVFEMAFNGALQGAENGSTELVTQWLRNAGDSTSTVIIDSNIVADDRRFVRVTGRTDDWNGLDIRTTSEAEGIRNALDVAGNYTITVSGRALGSGTRNFKLTQSRGATQIREAGRVNNINAGGLFTLTTTTALTSPQINEADIRIQTDPDQLQDFEIYNIVITRSGGTTTGDDEDDDGVDTPQPVFMRSLIGTNEDGTARDEGFDEDFAAGTTTVFRWSRWFGATGGNSSTTLENGVFTISGRTETWHGLDIRFVANALFNDPPGQGWDNRPFFNDTSVTYILRVRGTAEVGMRMSLEAPSQGSLIFDTDDVSADGRFALEHRFTSAQLNTYLTETMNNNEPPELSSLAGGTRSIRIRSQQDGIGNFTVTDVEFYTLAAN